MAKGRFEISRGSHGMPGFSFLVFDSDDEGTLCFEASTEKGLRARLTPLESEWFKAISPGASRYENGLRYFVEWREKDVDD